MSHTSGYQLYLVYLRDAETALDPSEFDGMRQLDAGLFLIQSDESRSRVYHAVKHATGAEKLLVAPLADDPKFKGMEAGALKWLRQLDQT